MPISKKTSAKPSPTVQTKHDRAPFGFIFFFFLLVATLAFSTFYVTSQTMRENAVRREARQSTLLLQERLNQLQTQVNMLSTQVSLHQSALERLSNTTSTNVPRPGQR